VAAAKPERPELRTPTPKPEPSVVKSPLHRAEHPCFLFTELFAASPGRQGAGLLHKGDADVEAMDRAALLLLL
jgi:hypothetical protein